MRYNKIGINMDSIDGLILDIYNYGERINKTFNQISILVEQTKPFYDCSSGDDFRRRFNSLSSNFTISAKNVNSYAEDLVKLKNRYQIIDEDATQRIKIAIAKIDTKNKGGKK